ncbi:hypothetical protein BDGGKGIB_02226 [Nodularia sphaerocarpa UHCC 0038]|nr:hypothetical protein BDGGKGIB_02226 [Nodularia sphaerocarpa UHCC 0038]
MSTKRTANYAGFRVLIRVNPGTAHEYITY